MSGAERERKRHKTNAIALQAAFAHACRDALSVHHTWSHGYDEPQGKMSKTFKAGLILAFAIYSSRFLPETPKRRDGKKQKVQYSIFFFFLSSNRKKELTGMLRRASVPPAIVQRVTRVDVSFLPARSILCTHSHELPSPFAASGNHLRGIYSWKVGKSACTRKLRGTRKFSDFLIYLFVIFFLTLEFLAR